MTVPRLVLSLILPTLIAAHSLDAACTNPTMQELTAVDTGGAAGNHGIGDVDRDGWGDLVVGSAATDDVRIFFGNGDGTFDPHVSYPVTDAGLLVVRDLNADQWPDIVVNHGNSSIGVLLNDGDGTFANVASISTTLHLVASIEAADFNGDNYPDLLISDLGTTAGENDVHIFWNNGSGAFPTRIEWTIPGSAADAVAGDFNGDGMRDVAVVYGAYQGADPGTLAIFLNSNNGNFPALASYSYTLPSPGTNSAYDIAMADFDANGRLDLLVSKYDGFKLYVGNADGSFSNGMSGTISPADFVAVAAADFDEDGKTDAVFASQNGSDIVFLTGQGNANFNMPPYRYARSYSHMTDVATTDFDNDGRPDLLLSEYDATEVRVYRNVCSSRYSTITVESSANPSTYPQTVTLQVQIKPRGGNLTPTGTVSLSIGGNTIDTQPVTAGTTPNGVASFALNLKPGSYLITATYSGDGSYASTSTTYNQVINRPVAGPPLEVVATGSGSQILVQWIGTQAAASYDVLRLNAGTWETIANTVNEVYADSAITNTQPYVYAVRARTAGDELSANSNADVANTRVYTSNPLSAGAPVRAVDVSELRSMVDGLRAAVSLPPASYTDPTLTAGMTVSSAHLTELRSALGAALAPLSLAPPAYNQPAITAGTTVIRRIDQQEIRDRLN